MSPDLESFKNSKEFFVMNIIVKFREGKCLGVKGNWMNFIIVYHNWKYSS